MIIKQLKENAENFLGDKIDSAVITVPVYFNNFQRESTKQAAEIAGLKVKRIINDPIAAVLAYGLNKTEDTIKKVIVFDLGGRTFNVTLLELFIENNEIDFEVLANNVDIHFGGYDFDQRILELCIEHYEKTHDKELCNLRAISRLKIIIEKAKIQLSSRNEFEIFVPKILFNRDLKLTITRKDFEDLCQDLFNKCITYLEKTLEDAEVTKDEISDIILIGGSTKIPKIKDMLKNFFNKSELHYSIEPNEAVVIGATIQSAIIDKINEKNYEYDIKITNESNLLSIKIKSKKKIPRKIFENKFQYEELIKNKYFLNFNDIDEIVKQLNDLIKSEEISFIEETDEIILIIPIKNNLQIKEILIKIKEKEKNNKDILNDLDEIFNKFYNLEKKNNRLKNKVNNIEKENIELKDKVNNIEKENIELKDKVNNLEKENIVIKNRIEIIEKKINKKKFFFWDS